jgi:hypothetical protein
MNGSGVVWQEKPSRRVGGETVKFPRGLGQIALLVAQDREAALLQRQIERDQGALAFVSGADCAPAISVKAESRRSGI